MNKHSMNKIFVDGFYGYRNLGDDYILYSIVDSIKYADKKAQVFIFSNAPANYNCLNSYNLKIIKRKHGITRLFNKLLLINKCNIYIIGGGGLFPSEDKYNLIDYYVCILYASLLGKKTCFYGIDVVKANKKYSKIIWNKMLKRVSFLYSRDFETKKVLSFNKDHKIECFSDVTFSLEESEEKKYSLESYKSVKIILWALAMPFFIYEIKNDLHIQNRYKLFKEKIINNIKRLPNYEHVFIPFYYENDMYLIEDIIHEIPKNIKTSIIKYSDFTKVRNNFLNKSLCVCMRFHSVVFALHSNANFISISYAPKIQRLLDSYNLSDLYVKYGVRKTDNYHEERDLDDSFDKLLFNKLHNTDLSEIKKADDVLRCKSLMARNALINWIRL